MKYFIKSELIEFLIAIDQPILVVKLTDETNESRVLDSEFVEVWVEKNLSLKAWNMIKSFLEIDLTQLNHKLKSLIDRWLIDNSPEADMLMEEIGFINRDGEISDELPEEIHDYVLEKFKETGEINEDI